MKKFLKIVFLLTLIIVSIALLFVGNGYKMYKEAIEEIKQRKLYRNFRLTTKLYQCSIISRRS